jgi:hypothetical protein
LTSKLRRCPRISLITLCEEALDCRLSTSHVHRHTFLQRVTYAAGISRLRNPNQAEDRESKKTDFLFQESLEVGRKISALVALDERLLTVGATTIIAGVTLAATKGFPEALLALPAAIAALVAFTTHLHAELFALSGYKAALEEALELELGGPSVIWESRIVPSVRLSSIATRIAHAFFLTIAGAGVAAAVVQAFHSRHIPGWQARHSTLILGLVCAEILVFLPAAFTAYGFARGERNKAWKIARTILIPSTHSPK